MKQAEKPTIGEVIANGALLVIILAIALAILVCVLAIAVVITYFAFKLTGDNTLVAIGVVALMAVVVYFFIRNGFDQHNLSKARASLNKAAAKEAKKQTKPVRPSAKS